MKKFSLFLAICFVVLAAACKKSETTPDPGQTATPFAFSSLTAQDTVISPNGAATITAAATGDGLTYSWSEEKGNGTFIGSGATVQWTICHPSRFRIMCEVKDQYNHSEIRYVNITARY